MKRIFCALLAAAMLLLPCMALADVILEPEDSFYKRHSYLQYGADGRVCHTVEKQVVSHDAICGAYYFKNKQLYASACAEYLHHCDYKEFFVSGIYNVLAARGADLRGFATDLHLPFGTPAEYAQAEQEANKAAFEMLM